MEDSTGKLRLFKCKGVVRGVSRGVVKGMANLPVGRVPSTASIKSQLYRRITEPDDCDCGGPPSLPGLRINSFKKKFLTKKSKSKSLSVSLSVSVSLSLFISYTHCPIYLISGSFPLCSHVVV